MILKRKIQQSSYLCQSHSSSTNLRFFNGVLTNWLWSVCNTHSVWVHYSPLVSLSSCRTQLIDAHKGRSRSVDNGGGTWHWSKWQRFWTGPRWQRRRWNTRARRCYGRTQEEGDTGMKQQASRMAGVRLKKRLKIKPLLSIGPYLCFLFSVQEELIIV